MAQHIEHVRANFWIVAIAHHLAACGHNSPPHLATLLIGHVLNGSANGVEPAREQNIAVIERHDINGLGELVRHADRPQQAAIYRNYVQIVDAQQIAASGASNFAELAQFLIKGANIGYSPDEGEYTIRLDGGGDRDTLVVLDGVPLYDRGPALEEIWGTTTIDPHMIDHVEVFRGGNSLFFGSNGGIGVVSIRTK